MKKAIIFAVSALLFIAPLAACATNGAPAGDTPTSQVNASSGEASPSGSQAAEQPTEAKAPITLSAFTPYVEHMSDPATNNMNIKYEEKTGVHIDWTQSQDAATDLNLLIASGEYPDMLVTGFTPEQVMLLVEAGGILPLNDLIETVGVNYKSILEERPDFKEWLTAPDGNIYTAISTDIGVHMPNRRKMFVKSDWLAAYKAATGGAIPETTADFETMLRWFKENDPNGNGADDEIPLMGSTNAEDDPIYYLMSAFTQISLNYFHMTDSGDVVFEATNDDWREGLRWMKKLYQDGLLYAEESYVQDRDQLRAIVNVTDASAYKVGCIPSFWEGRFVDTNALKWTDFEPIPPLAGPSGVRGATITQMESLVMQCAITTACEEPEVAMSWLDWWLGEEGSFAHTWGMEEGADYSWVDKPDFLGNNRSVTAAANSYEGNFRYGENGIPKMDRENIRYAATNDESVYNTNNSYVLFRAGKMYEPFYVASNIPPIAWAQDTGMVAEMTELRTLINDEVRMAYTEFILGIRDLDNDWQAYQDGLNALGLERYLELMKEYYA